MKINGIEVKGKSFAYDECHKIYILEKKYQEAEAIKIGYNILSIDRLEETYNKSCPLKFINSWDLKKQYVAQFEDSVVFEL